MEVEGCPRRPNPSCLRTFLTQAALCLAFYVAFNIGRPRRAGLGGGGREAMDLYFLSVRGGARPLKQQAQLLRQMEKAMKIYKPKFVLSIGQLGDDDPLRQNVTLTYSLLKIPWYTTTASDGQVRQYFLKSVEIPHGKLLDIISLDTGPFQDYLREGELRQTVKEQLDWIRWTLASSDSNWRIIVGFDQLIACAEGKVTFYEPLHRIFLEYGANAYLSQQGCAGNHFNDEGFVYIGHPGSHNKQRSHKTKVSRDDLSEIENGFLLHRVSALEMDISLSFSMCDEMCLKMTILSLSFLFHFHAGVHYDLFHTPILPSLRLTRWTSGDRKQKRKLTLSTLRAKLLPNI